MSSLQLAIPQSTKIQEPILISDLVSHEQSTVIEKLFVTVGSGSRVIFQDGAQGTNRYLKEIIVEIEPYAYVEFLGNYTTDGNSFQYLYLRVVIKEYGNFNCSILASGSGTSDLIGDMVLSGVYAQADLAIASMSYEHGSCSIETKQHHEGNYSQSCVKVKQLAMDTAQARYKSLIDILPAAKQVIAHQKHKTLLLNSTAQAYANPQLNVQHNKEVYCSHGSAISQLDELLIWYALARGLTRAQARLLLLEGFFSDLCNNIVFKAALLTQLMQRNKFCE